MKPAASTKILGGMKKRVHKDLNAMYPNSVTVAGLATLRNALQSLNTSCPITCSPSFNCTPDRLLQLRNTREPNTVTVEGIVTLRNALQLRNAPFPILSSPSFNLTSSRLMQP